MKIAVYPGSFDPITNGHLDIINRAKEIFDKVIIAIAVNSSKKTLFTLEERKELIEKVISKRKELDGKVEVVIFRGLLTTFAKEIKATAIVRGIRAVTDFDYEYAIYQVNRELAPEVDTVFLLASREFSFISSTIIKEVARYGRVLKEYAPPEVNEALLKKFGHIQ
ncbi:MAG: phosphopantetheine adenylyltransferase [Leptospiraceae bacterium]|nr:MAG: phosphopantetheine adenylyltransferase [Leptospiraceae bacterium]